MTILRERISRFVPSRYLSYAAGWTLRVWRQESLETESVTPGRTHLDADIDAAIQKFSQSPVMPLGLARAILELPRVNAVEVTDIAGFGEVLYKDWP